MTVAAGTPLNTILRQGVAGVLVGVMGITLVLSLATIIFRNDLSAGLARGAGWSLIGLVIIGGVTAATSSFRGLAAGPQDAPAVIVAAVGAAVAGRTEDPMATLAAFVILASALTGLLLVIIGRFRWGTHIRQMPYPVVAGFIGGTGVLLIMAGWDMLFPATPASGRLALLVVPGLALALFIFALSRWLPRSAAPVGVIAATFVAYHVMATIGDVDRVDGIARGVLLGPFPEGSLVELDVASELWAADWGAILGQLPAFGAMLLVVPIALLLTTGALERAFEVDVNENRELKMTGTALLVAAPFAGLAGYAFMSDTVISRRIGGASRIPPLICAGMAAVVLFVGAGVVSLIPVAIPAGLLIAIGLDFVITWAWDIRHRVGPAEYAVILSIVATVAFFGFLPGVGLGVAAATLLFVVRYSRIPSVRTIATARDRRSRVQRSSAEEAVLNEAGNRILIFELQGYLFFGTAEQIVSSVRDGVEARPDVEAFIVDLARVTGIDSSAMASFERLARFAADQGVGMVLCAAGSRTEPIVRPLIDEDYVAYEPDLDRALERKEEELLAATSGDLQRPSEVVWDDVPRLEMEQGVVIIAEGQLRAGVFFLESGRARVLPNTNSEGSRQATLLPGSVIGELSHLSGGPATATVVCDTVCVLRHMSPDWLEDLARNDPSRALVIENAIGRRLAEKLIAANRTIRSLE